MYKEEKELWVKFACAALSAEDGLALAGSDAMKVDCDSVAAYADEMVRLYYRKFKDC